MDELHQNSQNSWEKEVIFGGYSDGLPMKGGFVPIGGDMGGAASDFEVSEIPAYMPCGEGEHLYLWVEKKEKATQEVTKAIEKAFGVREIHVGCAGKKDVHAITRQWISVQTPSDGKDVIEKLNAEDNGFKIVYTSRHTNKLRMGHLLGNRFVVSLYGVTAIDEDVSKACTVLSEEGFVNYFGRQRFGFDGGNVSHGVRILLGGRADHQMKKLYVSALQSAMFNLNAGRRFMKSGYEVFAGDVMQKMHSGCFICDDPETDNARVLRKEIVITLGLYGKKIMQGTGVSLENDQSVIKEFEDFWRQHDSRNQDLEMAQMARYADGARRAMWVRPERVSFKRFQDDGIKIDFTLPSGSYATVFLRQLCGSSFTR